MKINRKKLCILTGCALFVVANLFAANNEKGIEYYRAELYEAAKLFFLQQTNQSALEKAENYYYLGQVYYQFNKEDSASYYYRKAIEANPEYPFGYIGEGRMELKKGNKKAVDDLFKKANNYAKKDASVQTTIAEVYLDAGDNGNVIIALDRARRVNNKYSGIYIVEGDMLMKQGKVGEACSRYENAILFNNSDKLAHLKLAQVYKQVNTDAAFRYLDKLVAMDPNYVPAYVLIGDINREAGIPKKALDAYEKFIAVQGIPLLQYERYAQTLYLDKQYSKALDQIKYVIAMDPNNLVMKRSEAYCNFQMENYELGFEQINRFMEIMPKERQIYQDYATQAQLAEKVKKPEQALVAYSKAIEFDFERAMEANTYKEMGTIAYNAGMYPEAISYFEKHFEKSKSPEALDYYFNGEANLRAAIYYTNTDNIKSVTTPNDVTAYETTFNNYVKSGNDAYLEVIKRFPNSALGYMGRARINGLLDVYSANKTGKTDGYAKPVYEEALSFLSANNEDGSKNKDIIEVYRYLVSLYGAQNNTASIVEYSKKILDIDPTDEGARNTLNLLKIKYP